jgi:FkbM family methyltransferase
MRMGILSGLRRRLLLYWHKPRHWRLRPGTIDRRVFREVVIDNEYRLAPRFHPRDVIVDVGAHVGSFAYAVLRRGAGTVYCCEPSRENFGLLQHNLRPFGAGAHLFQGAVWRSDREVTHLMLQNEADPRNTGAAQVVETLAAEPVAALPFDRLIQRATEGGARRVRLLKLDCEGSEWPILFTSRMLHLVDAICGEYHVVPSDGPFAVAGHGDYTPGALVRFLTAQGFRAHFHAHPKAPERVGLFFAERVAAREATPSAA